MKTTRNSFLASLLVGVCLLGSACTAPSVSTTITALNAVADAASVAVVVAASLSASNTISAADAAMVSTYAQEISAATTKSITEFNSKDTNTTKITVITEAFAGVVAPAFGPTASPQIIAVTNAVGTAIELFLNQMHSSGTLTFAKVAPHTPVTLEKGDKAKLKVIQTKTAETLVRAKALVKK